MLCCLNEPSFTMRLDIRQSIEDYEDMTSLKDFASEIRALKTRADALRKECLQHKGTLQDMGTELRKHLNVLLLKSKEATAVPVSAPAASIIRPISDSLKLKLPAFSGKTLDWSGFWNLFSAIMKDNPSLSSSQRAMHLITAMHSEEARKVASQAAGTHLDYDAAVEALHQRFERKRTIFYNHFQLWSNNKTIRLTYSDISDRILLMKSDMRGFQQCKADTLGHLSAAHLESCFSYKLHQR